MEEDNAVTQPAEEGGAVAATQSSSKKKKNRKKKKKQTPKPGTGFEYDPAGRWEVVVSPEKGRCLIAKRDIVPGEPGKPIVC